MLIAGRENEKSLNMIKRSSHGTARHRDAGRPTGEAARDRIEATEIYRDVESGYYIFVGSRGRTHVFRENGAHHTSFRTTRANRNRRVSYGKWVRLNRKQLPFLLK